METHPQEYITVGDLRVARPLHDLVRDEIVPGTGIDAAHFWNALRDIVRDLGPKNRALLEKRDALQEILDAWHRERKGNDIDVRAHEQLLRDSGYLVSDGPGFKVAVSNVDDEIARIAGPELVVPVDNARYALNAANARWGSLFDALYGTDVISEEDGAEKGVAYNPKRGARVMEYANRFLDGAAALERGKYADVTAFVLNSVDGGLQLQAQLADGTKTHLADTSQFVGYLASDGELTSVLLRNNELHIEIRINRADLVGSTHPAGVKDVVLEAADSLQLLSLRGRMVPEIADENVREIFVFAYRLIYEVLDEEVRIIAFLHGARDFGRLLREGGRLTSR